MGQAEKEAGAAVEREWIKHSMNDKGVLVVEELPLEAARLMAPFPRWEDFRMPGWGLTCEAGDHSFNLRVEERSHDDGCRYFSEACLRLNWRGSASWDPLAYVRIDSQDAERCTVATDYQSYYGDAAKAACHKLCYEKLVSLLMSLTEPDGPGESAEPGESCEPSSTKRAGI